MTDLSTISQKKWKEVKVSQKIENDKNSKIKVEEKIKSLFQKDRIKMYISILLFLLSIFFYYLSLEGCFKEEYECLASEKIIFFKILAAKLIISFFISSLLLFFTSKNILPKFLFPFFVVIYIIMTFCQNGYDLRDHGRYNRELFLIFNIILYCIYQIIYLFIIYLKNKKYIKFTILLSVILIPILFYQIRTKDCSNWDIGIGNIKINNDIEKDACKIKKPKYCTIDFFDGVFDLSKFGSRKCEGKGGKRETLESISTQIKNKGNYFVFPDASTFTGESMKSNFQSIVLSEIAPVNNKTLQNFKGKPEVFLKFDSNNHGTVEIKLQKQDKLLEERRKIASKNSVKYETIIFIYIDALSRRHFHRKFPKTVNFLNKYLIDNKNKIKQASSYQFFKYLNFRDNTYMNVLPMFYGGSVYGQTGGINIIRHFKEIGYITAFTQNNCEKEAFQITDWSAEGIEYENYDHESISLFCDPNYHPPVATWKGVGRFSPIRKCFYDYDSFKYVFDYGYQFLKIYENERKFLRMGIIDAHESTMEVVKYLDQPLFDFLEFVMNNYFNEKTAIFIASDHGNNMLGINFMLQSDDFTYEKSLGLFYIIIEQENENLRYNQQRLVTAYDIHDTLLYMGKYNEKYKSRQNKGQSLFEKVDGLNRTCDKYYNDFDGDRNVFCTCIPFNE